MKDRFAGLHPAVNLCYFALVIGFSMALQHPAAQAISLICALLYARQLSDQSFGSALKLSLPIALFTAALNPLFNHRGATPLFSLPTGSFVTLESLLYGLSAGALLLTVLAWFICFNQCISADKFLFLFGRALPGLSLVMNMTLGFVPRFVTQYRAVSDAQKCLGRDMARGSWLQKAKNAAAVLSITLTWALENAADTADSMKSRGYGGKRSRYSVYPFTKRDGGFLALFLLSGGALIFFILRGCFSFDYFPSLGFRQPDILGCLAFGLYALLCAAPLFYNLWEEKRWNCLHSKI